jgi:hypothetical protein
VLPTVEVRSLFSDDESHPFRLPSKFILSPILAFTYMNSFLLQIPLQFDEAATHSSQDGYRTAPLQNRYKGLEKYCSACADVCLLPTRTSISVSGCQQLFRFHASTFRSRNIHQVQLHARFSLVFVIPITSAAYWKAAVGAEMSHKIFLMGGGGLYDVWLMLIFKSLDGSNYDIIQALFRNFPKGLRKSTKTSVRIFIILVILKNY